MDSSRQGRSDDVLEQTEGSDIDEELHDAALYEEAMDEIRANSSGSGGVDNDPFDRNGEYDENVNLNAPPIATPDIEEHVPEEQEETQSSVLGLIDMKELKESLKDMSEKNVHATFAVHFPVRLQSWQALMELTEPDITSSIARYRAVAVPGTQEYSETNFIDQLKTAKTAADVWATILKANLGTLKAAALLLFKDKSNDENTIRKLMEALELDMLAAETLNPKANYGTFRSLFSQSLVGNDYFEKLMYIGQEFQHSMPRRYDLLLRFLVVLVETKVWKNEKADPPSVCIDILKKGITPNALFSSLEWFA